MIPANLPLFLVLSFVTCLLLSLSSATATDWIQYPADGIATLTHYTLPENYIAACGCTADSTHYPTAAMSQMAYGSSAAYGPACGRCFKITLLNTFLSDPPFYPAVKNSVVVKITDLCPADGDDWCSATAAKPNAGGAYVNFDLAWPSNSISSDFFPSNVSEYGYTDFGVWNVSYESVDCLDGWEGSKVEAALGSAPDLGSVCCPANPSGNDTCPSYSEDNGIPPDTTTSTSSSYRSATANAALIFLSACAILIASLLV